MPTISSRTLADKPIKEQGFPWLRCIKYLALAIFANGSLWGISIFYLKTAKPSYTSEAIFNVAGSGPGVSVNLPDIGQAYTSNTSAFGSASSDPRENYKIIVASSSVIKNAAKNLKLSEEEFGEPKIKIINNTTMLKIEVSALTPILAQQKLTTLFQTFNNRISSLREAEQKERNQSIQKSLNEAQMKLKESQHRLSSYKSKSGFNSSEQVKNMISNIEVLRKQRAEVIAKQQEAKASLEELSINLKLSAQDAADALVLQTDQQFQKALSEYTTAFTTLKTLMEERGPNYPDVIVAKQQQESALNILLERGKVLLNRQVEQKDLERLNLDNTAGSGVKRAELLQQLITLSSTYQGLTAQAQALSHQIHQLENQLNNLSQKELVLDELLRELQISEAIFASTLAKADLGKGDAFGSFPLIQIIEEPNIPKEPTSPKPKLVLAGSVLGSLLVSLGLTLIWWRDPILATSKNIIKEIIA